jgi:NAD(P)-dependent dehydrogenase (short-subunit alcohol dehydrogenase family)
MIRDRDHRWLSQNEKKARPQSHCGRIEDVFCCAKRSSVMRVWPSGLFCRPRACEIEEIAAYRNLLHLVNGKRLSPRLGNRRRPEQLHDALGTIDILVNNAAFQQTYETFEDNSDEEFEETYRVNVFGMFRLCEAILPQMKAGGSIINTGSIQSFDPSPPLIAYASTKAAIVNFTRSLSSFAMKQGVRVTPSRRVLFGRH